jgi:replicative DNA helicase
LAADVAFLLLRLGIISRTKKVYKEGNRPWYLVYVSGVEAQMRFLDRVGAFGERQKQAEKLSQVLVDVNPNTNVDTLPNEIFDRVRMQMKEQRISQRRMAALRGTSYGGTSHFKFSPSRETVLEYAEILDDDSLRQQAASDLFWDRVVAIEPDGEEEVYDLTVPGPASWLADGIVSHNSGAIEQDADVILFLYREAVYCDACRKRDNSCDKGHARTAEVIVGKQRNGPLGMEQLTFLGEFMRFESQSKRNDEYVA